MPATRTTTINKNNNIYIYSVISFASATATVGMCVCVCAHLICLSSVCPYEICVGVWAALVIVVIEKCLRAAVATDTQTTSYLAKLLAAAHLKSKLLHRHTRTHAYIEACACESRDGLLWIVWIAAGRQFNVNIYMHNKRHVWMCLCMCIYALLWIALLCKFSQIVALLTSLHEFKNLHIRTVWFYVSSPIRL